MKTGYIKLFRSCTENPLYFSEPFTKWQAWTDLLILANHSESITYVRGIPLTIKRGQVLSGEQFLADRWKWSRGKVRRFIAFLSSKPIQQIVQQKNNVCSIITVTNYNAYQGNGTTNSTADSTTDGQQTVQQTDTLKNVKNVKNVKKRSIVSPNDIFSKPDSDTSPEVIRIPIQGNEEQIIRKNHVKEWEKLYPNVLITDTLREIRGWNLTRRAQRKTKSGVMRHINSWLSREQNKG